MASSTREGNHQGGVISVKNTTIGTTSLRVKQKASRMLKAKQRGVEFVDVSSNRMGVGDHDIINDQQINVAATFTTVGESVEVSRVSVALEDPIEAAPLFPLNLL